MTDQTTKEALQQELERLEKENEELELSEQVDKLKTQVDRKKRSKEDKKVLGVIFSLLLILIACWLGGWLGTFIFGGVPILETPKFYSCLFWDNTAEGCIVSPD